MADRCHKITGSDRAFDKNPNHPVYKLLKSKGIHIVPQDGDGINSSFDFAVFSTAVEHDHPEFLKARSSGIPIKTRPEYLAEITLNLKTIAVAGTSGKSTASGMLAFLMRRLGLNPNFIGGGRVKQFKTKTNPGNYLTSNSDLLIIEACESDGTIVNYKPEHTVILNLDLDHHSIDKTAMMFETLIKNTAGMVVTNADDSNLGKFIKKNVITFSIDNPSDYKADNIVYNQFNIGFSLKDTKFSLSIPGKYNLYNALSCIAILSEIGIPLKDIAGILHEFKGIDRRFDIHLKDGKKLVIDDYAHNPHKIASLMQAAKKIADKICYIFQPHGFAPTKMMKNEYIAAFSENLRDSDCLILLPIFYAGGSVRKDISSHDLSEGIKKSRRRVEVVRDRNEAILKCLDYNACIVIGARDETLSYFAREIADLIRTNTCAFNSA
jgi:UDP-N-acetylmuramate--alanine ligase